jgi:5-formyltetrahydrofolate cyclo-ligase
LRIALADAGYEVLLPRVVNDHLEWVLDGPETTTSTMGIDEPTGPSVPLAPVRALLIPALAVTLAGDRLGKGGGYYDRVLSTVESSSTVVAAIVHDSDITDEIPCEPHDRRVDWILTPTRAINCSGTLFETPDI